MFTEEFQVAFYEAINACLDERDFVIGETPWNFANFGTQQGPMRAGGNRKGGRGAGRHHHHPHRQRPRDS